MDKDGKFNGLKNLHSNMHDRKGLASVVNDSFAVRSENGFESFDKSFHTKSSENGNKKEDTEYERMEKKSSLINSIKNVYGEKGLNLCQPKIFVGNISYKLSTTQLKEFFSSFGRVIYAQIIKDRVKKRSKGYGFVTFSNDIEVEKVLQASDEELILDGRTLRVNRAEKKRRSKAIKESNNEMLSKDSFKNFLENYVTKEEAIECKTAVMEDIKDDVISIASLNDDILLLIFSCLPLRERIVIERVCHRWNNLARKTWLTATHLDFNGVFIPSWTRVSRGLTDDILMSMFKRGCHNLKSLNLSHSPRSITDYSLYLIAQNCSQLQDINLSGIKVTMRSLKEMSCRCSKLKKVTLRKCYEVNEKALWWLFKQCQDLEYIDIAGNTRITGQCFYMLTDKCKTVIVNECKKLSDDGLQHLASRCHYLENLDISYCLALSDSGIIRLLTQCKQLKSLSFRQSSSQVTTRGLMALRHQTQLVELDLSIQDKVDDNVLHVVASSCSKLRYLNIEVCHNVTDLGLVGLAKCSQLQKLNISYLSKLNDASVEGLAKNGTLKELIAKSCSNLTDIAVNQLAIYCPHLKELDICGSERISNRSLDCLEEHFGDNDFMVLSIGGTGISNERVLKTRKRHPNWNIITHDFTNHRLRSDYDPLVDWDDVIMDNLTMDDDDSEDDKGPFQFHHSYDDESYLIADDPSMWEYDPQWIS
ncbi:F-box/LRR-repeat protein 2-like [Xenia sp. Carnegie-2017]|uniref:F-box/LRR-repeat protein 2-like n=1 Tax=Xenia sp. Carnegie-2017 TaxID=2897299 RepID=UPI001F04638D|nr:F-box/LRR-repeat protein 2-like [Xenia sp. Carnegie-2017]